MSEIISNELPPEFDGNHAPTPEQRFATLAAVQRDAIRRFVAAINPKAQRLMETVKPFGPNSWEACKLAALELLANEINPPPICERCGEPDPCACEPATQGRVW